MARHNVSLSTIDFVFRDPPGRIRLLSGLGVSDSFLMSGSSRNQNAGREHEVCSESKAPDWAGFLFPASFMSGWPVAEAGPLYKRYHPRVRIRGRYRKAGRTCAQTATRRSEPKKGYKKVTDKNRKLRKCGGPNRI